MTAAVIFAALFTVAALAWVHIDRRLDAALTEAFNT